MVQFDESLSSKVPTAKQNGASTLDQHHGQQEQVVGIQAPLGDTIGAHGSSKENFNSQLVEETRDLIRHEYETNGGESKYSSIHYAEIMDSGSPAACLRYLIQRDMRPNDAFELIKSALSWRKTNKVDELTAKSMAKDFWLKAPIGFTGKTRAGNDIIYIIGKNYRKPGSPEVKQIVKDFVAHVLATWDRQRMSSLEKWCIVMDVSYTTIMNIDLDFISWMISIIDYFPARFEAIQVVGIPFILRPVIRLMISWLPARYKRICYCTTMEQMVDDVADWDQLPAEAGGQAPDIWRLAPREAPWFRETDLFSETVIESIHKAIIFNTSDERIEQLTKMQLDYESSSDT